MFGFFQLFPLLDFSGMFGRMILFLHLFCWYVWSYDFIHRFSRLIFQWATKVTLGNLCSNPYFLISDKRKREIVNHFFSHEQEKVFATDETQYWALL